MIYIWNLHYLLLPNILFFSYFCYFWTSELKVQLCHPNRSKCSLYWVSNLNLWVIYKLQGACSEVTASIPDLPLEDSLLRWDTKCTARRAIQQQSDHHHNSAFKNNWASGINKYIYFTAFYFANVCLLAWTTKNYGGSINSVPISEL